MRFQKLVCIFLDKKFICRWEPSILVFFTSNWKLHQDPKYGVNIIIENTEEEEKETKTLVYHGYEK